MDWVFGTADPSFKLFPHWKCERVEPLALRRFTVMVLYEAVDQGPAPP